MSQESISSLALININHEVASQIYCPVVIGDFCSEGLHSIAVEEAHV